MLSNGDLKAIFGQRGFRRLLGVRLSSQLSDGLFQAGLAGSVLFNPSQKPDPLEIAIGFAILLLPYSLVGPYVGVFLDRWSRRNILMMANVARGVLVIPIVALVWVGAAHALFAVLALFVIAINRFFLSGLSASLPHVVDSRRLVTGNAVATTLGTVCFTTGLGIAAVLVNVVGLSDHGYATTSAIAIAGYLLSALLTRISFDAADLGPDERTRHDGKVTGEIVEVARGMVAGLRHLGRRAGAAYAVGAQTGFRVLFGVLAIATLLLFRNYFAGGQSGSDFGRSIAGLGQVVVAGGIGSLVAALVTPMATRRLGGWRWVTVLLAATGVMIIGLGLPFKAQLLVVATFLLNIASQGTKIVVDTALQHECADEYRGRVFSVNDTGFNLAFVIGLFTGALLLPGNGKSVLALVLVGVAFMLLALWYGIASARWARRAHHDIATGPAPLNLEKV